MTPADVERLLRVLHRVDDYYRDSTEPFERGISSGLAIAINAIRVELEEDEQ